MRHRWERQWDQMLYFCTTLPIGARLTLDKCEGCGIEVSDKAILQSYFGAKGLKPDDLGIEFFLDIIVEEAFLSQDTGAETETA